MKDDPARRRAAARALLLPLVFLTVALLGGMRVAVDRSFVFLPPPLVTLVMAALLASLFVRGRLVRLETWLGSRHGVLTNIRDNTGIQTDSAGNVTCYYWLHVHPANKNVIHIESPANDTFTLGQFFDVSNAWSQANGFGAQKLDATHVATFTLQPGDKIVAYVDLGDGKGPQAFTGDPRSIVLRSHEVITIEISPPDVNPPPAFDWKSAANSGL